MNDNQIKYSIFNPKDKEDNVKLNYTPKSFVSFNKQKKTKKNEIKPTNYLSKYEYDIDRLKSYYNQNRVSFDNDEQFNRFMIRAMRNNNILESDYYKINPCLKNIIPTL